MQARKFYIIVGTGLFLSLQVFSVGKKNDTVELKWETPAEGTAVSYENEDDYLNQPPVLFSEQNEPEETIVKIDMEMVGKGLILPGAEDMQAEESLGEKAAKKAIEFYERKIHTVNVNGSVLNIERDCSFFVRAAYWEGSGHKVDLFRESLASTKINMRTANGVTLISEYFRQNHRYQKSNPKIGDIIVFDNTYDKNRNHKRDDYLTHVGIVTDIRDDGTIEFYHGNIGRQIKKGYINFKYKNTSRVNNRPVNSYIRPKYSWESNSAYNLSSYLVRSFVGY